MWSDLVKSLPWLFWTVCDNRNCHLKLKQWTFTGPDWHNGPLICRGDKKDRGCSSQGNVKDIQKYSHDKGNEIWEGQTPTAASVPEKPSGTWLWPRSSQGHCGEELKKNNNTKKPYMSQPEKDTFLLQSWHVQLLCALQDPERCSGVRGHFLIHPMCAQAQTLPQPFVTFRLFPDNFFLTRDIKMFKTQRRCTLLGPSCERVLPKGCIHENMTLDLYNQDHFPCTLNWICIVQITQNYSLPSHRHDLLWL